MLGLGAIGAAATAVLLEAGHRVTVWNRGPEPVRAAVALGAEAVPAPAGVAVADVVLTALFDDEAAVAVLGGVDGAAAALRPGTVHVATDSLSRALSDRLGAEAAAAGRGYVAAPVFGRPDQLGSTAVLPVSGAAATVARVWPLRAQLGRPRIVGERPGQAHLVKLAGNFLVTAAVEALAEASALVARAGVDQAALHAVVTDALFPGRLHEKFGAMIAADRYPADARLSLGAKDNRLLLDAARDLDVALPVAELVRERFRAAAEHAPAGVEEDWSSIARRSFAQGAA